MPARPIASGCGCSLQGVEWRNAIYGLAATLEHKAADGRWERTHHLRFSHLTGEADWLRYGDPRGGYRLVGLSGSDWRPVRVPDDAQPGEYRIVKMVGGSAYAVALVIR